MHCSVLHIATCLVPKGILVGFVQKGTGKDSFLGITVARRLVLVQVLCFFLLGDAVASVGCRGVHGAAGRHDINCTNVC